MTEPEANKPAANPLPEAVVETGSRFSLVWVIPLVAAVIGAWLAFKTYSEQGPTITITFKTAEGMEAGKTKLKYKDVEFGQVETIELSDDLSHVLVTAKLVKSAEKYLTDKTRFWVVRARVAAGEVTGLGTLLGGAYIGMDPVLEGEPTYTFEGLEIPPIVTADDPGRHYRLDAAELGSVQIGSPIYFREIQVGEVVAYELDASGSSVDMQVFVRAPHHDRVYTNTRFWNASGLNVSIGAAGIEIDTQSLTSLLIGGIAFENPPGLEQGLPAEENTVFTLHPNRKTAFEKPSSRKSQWLLSFDGSVRGLSVGAPVEFRGIKLGEVIDINLELDLKQATLSIPVLIEIAAERLKLIGSTPDPSTEQDYQEAEKQLWNSLVARGLRAQLKTGSLVTGALFVDLDIYENAAPQAIVWSEPYPELPTIPTTLEEFRNVLTNVLQKFEQLSLDQMSDDIQKSLTALRQTSEQIEILTSRLNTTVLPGVSATLNQTQQTLNVAEKTLATATTTLSANSPLQRDAQRTLQELSAAARSFKILADYLQRHPESLIQGKSGRGR